MATKDVTVLRNFSHVLEGSFVRGEHRRIDATLADIFVEGNLVSICEHEHEGDETSTSTTKVLEVPCNEENIPNVAIEKPKTRSRRKKADE